MVEPGSKDPKEYGTGDGAEFGVEEVEFDVSTPESVMQDATKREYQYARLGLVVGALVVLAGVVLIILGYSGSVDIAFQSGTDKGHLVTGSLGVVIALAGVAILFFTRPKVRTTNRHSHSARRG
jgi:hypothetical protein